MKRRSLTLALALATLAPGSVGLTAGCAARHRAYEADSAPTRHAFAPERRHGAHAEAESESLPARAPGPLEPAPSAPAPEGAAALERAGRDDETRAPREAEGAPRPGAGVLTAGSFRDLDSYPRFVSLFAERGQTGPGELAGLDRRWGFSLAGRVPVVVHDRGRPVTDARVRLYDARERVVWEARTDNAGRAELFGGLFSKAEGPFGVEVRSGGRVATRWGIEPGTEPGTEPVALALEGARARPVVDVALLLDTTGSMGDELSYLQRELEDVLSRAKREAMRRGAGQDLELRVSLGFYRDHGDAYVLRGHPFTSDVREASRLLASETADGGGDFPEALDEALLALAERDDWSESARARLAFVVLDAPPHEDSAAKRRLERATRLLAARGVRLVPVAASGIDRSTEGLLRLLQAATAGTYVFLTDHSGVGEAHLQPAAREYEVEPLNDLLVRLLADAAREVERVKLPSEGRGELVSRAP